MPYQRITLDLRPPLAVLRLTRAGEGNRLDGAAVQELAEACEALADDPRIRVVIVTGEGGVFSQGWDLSRLLDDGSPPTAARRERLLGHGFSFLAELPRPVIAAVNGDAFSAGLELALACDVRVASDDARFGLPETDLGMIPMAGGTQRLARLVGRGKALELLLTAEPIDAQEARRIGLVSWTAPRERLMDEAEDLAGRIAAKGPIATRMAKEAVHRGLDMPLGQALRYEMDLTILLQTTEDRAEGVRAFTEKRTPRFVGR
jgi:enoyl-CoA hydratase